MLDELLGRAELKDRIEELEDDKHHLQRQLEAESERRSDAVSDKQDAEERINRLEDRITELEDRVDQQDTVAETDREPRQTESLRGDRLDAVLSRLESVSTEPEGALSAAITDADAGLPEAVTTAAGDCAQVVRQAVPTLYYTDDAGLVSVGLRPPIMPDAFTEWTDGFRIDREWFQPTGRLLFAVVRADVCAVGVYEGDSRTTFEGFESNVKSEHSKGGFSQDRFERIRDEQIDEHLTETRDTIETLIEAESPETVIITGEQAVVGELDGLADHTASTDAGGDPEDAIEHGFADFWTTRLVGI
ncbi:MAG: peptide chain release factor 1 (eRF1) [Halonotius sp. J07HN6]|nr:MAG: peptide chain release factor 1 (eRF1) [Halonotius sp. J07HN6]